MLPENAPVRLTSAQLEELNYTKLYRAYSAKGRKSKVDPRALFKVMVYGYQCGIYSSRKLEEACRYRVDFMWLLEENSAPDHSTIARFRTGRCGEAVEELFYQYVGKLAEWGAADHKAVFIDGTKIESCAGRYTFRWRGSLEKDLVKVQERVRKEAGFEKLEELQVYLSKEKERIVYVQEIGHRKSNAQKHWEQLDKLRQRWEKDNLFLAIMGEDRNSFSKTDHDATFMRMKDDHMKNGQLGFDGGRFPLVMPQIGFKLFHFPFGQFQFLSHGEPPKVISFPLYQPRTENAQKQALQLVPLWQAAAAQQNGIKVMQLQQRAQLWRQRFALLPQQTLLCGDVLENHSG